MITENHDSKQVRQISEIQLDPRPPASPIASLVWNLVFGEDKTEGWDETLPATCIECGTRIDAAKPLVEALQPLSGEQPQFGACDKCIEKQQREEAEAALKKYWEGMCPNMYLTCDESHPGWNRQAWDRVKNWTGQESLFLYGPKRRCKTFIMMLLLKRIVTERYIEQGRAANVGVLWPSDLEEFGSFNMRERKAKLRRWASYDYLGLDDPLLAGADNRNIVSFLKNLIDMRVMEQRPVIITSQISCNEFELDAQSYRGLSEADKARLNGLCGRIKELCTVIPFGDSQSDPRPISRDLEPDTGGEEMPF